MSSMALDGALPRSRSTDPTTSVDAGRSVDLPMSQAYVRDTLAVFGPFADHELLEFYEADASGQKMYGCFSPQRLHSARAELVEAGTVEATDEFCLTPSGRRAHVWRAVRASS